MTEFCCTTTEITLLNDEIHRVRFKPDDQKLFDFKGGQYIILHMPDGQKVPLSIASAPEEKKFIELHVRLIAGHDLAEEMIELFKAANSYQIEGAYGDCFMNDNKRDIVIIAGGTGFSPMKSMIESALAQKTKKKIELYLGAKVVKDLYQNDLVKEWERKWPNFSYTPVISDKVENWQGEIGFPHHVAIKELDHELAQKDIYISGSEQMVMAVYADLLAEGIDKSKICSDILNIKRNNDEIE